MAPKSIPNNGELAILGRIRTRAARKAGASLSLGIGDDCALLRLKPGEEAAITTDLSIENRHFRLETHPPEAIGHRTLARGLSDIASMGARPVAAFLSLGLRPNLTQSRPGKPAWIDAFLDGFLSLAAEYDTPLAGGDLAQSSAAMADIVLVGAVPRGKALLRSGGRPGDLLYVTGSLGGSAAGFELLSARKTRSARGHSISDPLAAHLWPQPRIPQGLWLRNHNAATAAIDISDGLSTDVDHLCAESHVAAEVDGDSIPIFPGASLAHALNGGEDYELLFTAKPEVTIPRKIAGVAITRIGRIMRYRKGTPRVLLVQGSVCRPLLPGGWQHFH